MRKMSSENFRKKMAEHSEFLFGKKGYMKENCHCKHFEMVKFIVFQLLSHVQLFATPWTVAHQAPLSTRFSRQEYWGGLPFPSPGDLPDPRIRPKSPALHVGSLSLSHQGSPLKFINHINMDNREKYQVNYGKLYDHLSCRCYTIKF